MKPLPARMRQHFTLGLVVLVGILITTIPGQAQTPRKGTPKQSLPTIPANLTATRAALEKYQDPIAAIHDGYFSTVGCVDYPKGGHGTDEMAYKAGGMGVHFLNPALIGPTLDSLKPQVLIYEPVGNRLRLVAAEWFVPVAAAKEAPMIFGTKLDGPMEGHAPVLPVELHHWDLHVWLWKANPNGLMHPTNPTIKCPESPYTFHEMATKMVKP